MDLAEHADQPQTVTVGGRAFKFSELSLESCARIQAWIKEHVPNPLQAVRQHLDGFNQADRALLLESARKDAQHWPPEVGTPAAAEALASSPSGLIYVLFEGLRAHDPDATLDMARWLHKRIRNDEGAARAIFSLLYGIAMDGEPSVPKS